MLWVTLLPEPLAGPAPAFDALHGLAIWCLQFTPKVTLLPGAVAMEVEASLRLFGGKRQLAEHVRNESAELGVVSLCWAPNSLAGLALARHGVRNGLQRPLASLLDGLPLAAIDAVQQHAGTLARLGCKALGDVRALPRGGLSRRFGKDLLHAMDQAYGLRPQTHRWVTLPDVFHGKLELQARIEQAPALLYGARRLLLQLCAWLSARCLGVTAITLRWRHDSMRAREIASEDALTVRTGEPTRDIEHLMRLLAEHLARVELAAPASDLELLAPEVQPFEADTTSLLPQLQEPGEPLPLVLERIAARLGPDRVLRPVQMADYRPEWQVHWQTADAVQPRQKLQHPNVPTPAFVLQRPLKLAVNTQHRPMYQGALFLLSGPHRIEAGWWHRTGLAGQDQQSETVVRDYWVALGAHAGVLWIYQTRMANEDACWYLHGVFA